MRISVFTGPFLTSEDPTRFGVQIPTEFWKVIAFIHDETRQLCATGYTMTERPGFDAAIFCEKDSDYAQAVPFRSP
jgi:endonuclease G